jgi:hypothetical protein
MSLKGVGVGHRSTSELAWVLRERSPVRAQPFSSMDSVSGT